MVVCLICTSVTNHIPGVLFFFFFFIVATNDFYFMFCISVSMIRFYQFVLEEFCQPLWAQVGLASYVIVYLFYSTNSNSDVTVMANVEKQWFWVTVTKNECKPACRQQLKTWTTAVQNYWYSPHHALPYYTDHAKYLIFFFSSCQKWLFWGQWSIFLLQKKLKMLMSVINVTEYVIKRVGVALLHQPDRKSVV